MRFSDAMTMPIEDAAELVARKLGWEIHTEGPRDPRTLPPRDPVQEPIMLRRMAARDLLWIQGGIVCEVVRQYPAAAEEIQRRLRDHCAARLQALRAQKDKADSQGIAFQPKSRSDRKLWRGASFRGLPGHLVLRTIAAVLTEIDSPPR